MVSTISTTNQLSFITLVLNIFILTHLPGKTISYLVTPFNTIYYMYVQYSMYISMRSLLLSCISRIRPLYPMHVFSWIILHINLSCLGSTLLYLHMQPLHIWSLLPVDIHAVASCLQLIYVEVTPPPLPAYSTKFLQHIASGFDSHQPRHSSKVIEVCLAWSTSPIGMIHAVIFCV